MRTIREIIKLISLGEPLTDEEVLSVMVHCGTTIDLLYKMGERFVLAAMEALHLYYKSRDWAVAHELIEMSSMANEIKQGKKLLKKFTERNEYLGSDNQNAVTLPTQEC